jgi:hypothetical protein
MSATHGVTRPVYESGVKLGQYTGHLRTPWSANFKETSRQANPPGRKGNERRVRAYLIGN